MITHKTCGMPLIMDESRDDDFRAHDIPGLFCTVCRDLDNEPLEILDEAELDSTDLEVLQK